MKKILVICAVFLLFSCKNTRKGIVINAQDSDRYSEVEKLKLDDLYNNLLNPQKTSEQEYKNVIKSWRDFHQQIGKIVKENNFDWEVKDSVITVLNKIYFDKNGKVDYYTFRIFNQNISDAKKTEYEKLLSENISKVKINLQRSQQYAQCGKVKYQNK